MLIGACNLVLRPIHACLQAAGSQRSNMMTVQSDCDQRDERLGWMGDANLSGDSMVLNFKYGAFLMSFFRVMLDELNPDGSSVDVAPNVRYGGRPADISWGTATIAFPYAAWKGDGDLGPAKASMAGLVAHVGNIGTQCKGVAGVTCPTKYGDWVPPNPPGKGQGPKPTKPFTSAFSYVDAAQKVAELARAVGNTTLADQLDALHAKLGDDFNAAFAKNGTYDNGVMTTFTLPLHLGIVPAAAKAAVQKNLLDMVATTYKDHNMCGIIGMKFLFEQLAAMGREDTALAVLESTSYPSIGFMAYNTYEDATENLWELWDAYTEGVGMNSRNHHMFSSYSKYASHPILFGCGLCPFRSVAGLCPVAPKHSTLTNAGVWSTAGVCTLTGVGVWDRRCVDANCWCVHAHQCVVCCWCVHAHRCWCGPSVCGRQLHGYHHRYLVEHVAGLSHSPGLDGRRTIRFGPAADLGVSSATVRSMLDHGEVSLDWERAGGLQCAKAPAGEVAELSCGRGGGVVKAVRFASWGTPFGSCGSFGADDRCAVSAVRLVERRCLGRANCTVPAAAELLGAAANCAGLSNGELPRLFVEVECDGAQAIHASAKVPLASDATIKIPTAGISAPVLVSGTGAVYSTAAITDGNNRACVTERTLGRAHTCQVTHTPNAPTKPTTPTTLATITDGTAPTKPTIPTAPTTPLPPSLTAPRPPRPPHPPHPCHHHRRSRAHHTHRTHHTLATITDGSAFPTKCCTDLPSHSNTHHANSLLRRRSSVARCNSNSEKKRKKKLTCSNNRAPHRPPRYVTAALGSGVHELTLKAGQVPTSVGPVQIADGAVVGSALQLACPANLRASRVRFASYGALMCLCCTGAEPLTLRNGDLARPSAIARR